MVDTSIKLQDSARDHGEASENPPFPQNTALFQ